MKLFIGGSASDDIATNYLEDCEKLLDTVLEENDLVFGVGHKGIMGLAYRIAKKKHRMIWGLCPKAYQEEISIVSCDFLDITEAILDSTLKIFSTSDAILLLPGGYGTVFEFFTAMQSRICEEMNKPIILYNSCGYYDSLLSFIKNMVEEKLAKDFMNQYFFVANTKEEVIQYLEAIKNSN